MWKFLSSCISNLNGQQMGNLSLRNTSIVFRSLMNNISFGTTLFLCILIMFFSQSNSISPALFFFLCFNFDFFLCFFLYFCHFFLFLPFSLFLHPSQFRYFLLSNFFQWPDFQQHDTRLLVQVKLMFHHQNLINFLKVS